MLSIIVIQNGAPRATLDRTIEAACSTGIKDISVIAQKGAATERGGVKSILSTDHPLATSLNMQLSKSNSSQVIIIDGRLAPSNSQLQAAVGGLTRAKATEMSIVPLLKGSETISLASLSRANLVNFLSSNPEWPFMCVAFDRPSALGAMPIRGDSMPEIIANLMIKMIAAGQQISAADALLPFSSGLANESSLRMSSEAMARVLQTAIENIEIEALFPSHPWGEFEKESAAASYHSLAASFVKLGDLDSAQECLRLSDSFEDSPRSLALKGIIAKQRGETLGAVANMVASLQQYENRKKNDGSHYLSFEPMNVEKLSDTMQAGLAALNQSDNETALQHFSSAVFSFDPFFAEIGLARQS